MPRKVFQVQVELCVHTVTCPGVWLCPSGKLSLQLYMLDSCVQTASVEAVFPLYFEDKFVFCKQFYKPQRLSDLQRALAKECFYVELIQWTNCDIGNVLATFITSLSDALFPAKIEGIHAGIDVDLLMEPSECFPGIIAPKIEITTKTIVEERLCPQQYKKCNAFVVTPKLVTSHLKTRSPFLRQKKVCHSYGYHRSRNTRCDGLPNNLKPPFVCRKVDEQLLARKPKGLDRDEPICKCQDAKDDWEEGSTNVTDEFLQSYYTGKSKKHQSNRATGKNKTSCHSHRNCPVCAKYSHFFDRVCTSGKPKITSARRNSDRCECSTTQLTDLHKNETKSNFDLKASKSSCCCQAQNQPATKKTVHISTNVNNCSCNEAESLESSSCCSSKRNYRSGGYQRRFYDSLEKFYDNLYKKTQEKVSSARNLNVCY